MPCPTNKPFGHGHHFDTIFRYMFENFFIIFFFLCIVKKNTTSFMCQVKRAWLKCLVRLVFTTATVELFKLPTRGRRRKKCQQNCPFTLLPLLCLPASYSRQQYSVHILKKIKQTVYIGLKHYNNICCRPQPAYTELLNG